VTDAIPRSARARGRIAPAKFAHIVLRTNRYEEMIAWWTTVLELQPLHANPFISFLTFDDEHHRIAIVRAPDLKDKVFNSVGVDHFAFGYGSIAELLCTYERLAEQGIRPSTSIHHGISVSFYYLDPDRNDVELQVDAFPSVAATNAHLAGGMFTRNPIGVLFDGDALVKRWRAGASDAELLKPLEGGPPDMRTAFAEH
jgi:catechol 2,3-dioxygenase-like lactoylglutathione lyase family enzyme